MGTFPEILSESSVKLFIFIPSLFWIATDKTKREGKEITRKANPGKRKRKRKKRRGETYEKGEEDEEEEGEEGEGVRVKR